MSQFCPDTESKLCIHSGCPAFTYNQPALWQCEICHEIHPTGGTCSNTDHLRKPVYIKQFPYCKKYDKELSNDVNLPVRHNVH